MFVLIVSECRCDCSGVDPIVPAGLVQKKRLAGFVQLCMCVVAFRNSQSAGAERPRALLHLGVAIALVISVRDDDGKGPGCNRDILAA